jgi:threonylcarbamoyladenosine tRNA methylthiotransferase MtaB
VSDPTSHLAHALRLTTVDRPPRLPLDRCYYSMVVSYYVQNFGCRAAQADGAAIERQFDERGMERASAPDEAEVVVLNTCTVTASADQDARAAIRRVHRDNPQARIVVTGCYAQRSPAELASLPGVTQVIGNSHKHQLAELLDFSQPTTNSTFVPLSGLICSSDLSERPTTEDRGRFSRRPATDDQRPALQELGTENRELRTGVFVSDIFAHTEFLAAPVFDAANQRTRPNLKIQDGCDNRCSFCVIPYVRGQSRSMHLEQILDEVNHLVSAGYRELVISGINLGRWGRDLESGVGSQVLGVRSQVSDPSHFALSQRRPTKDRRPTTIPPTTDDRRPSTQPATDDWRLPFLIRTILDSTDLEKLRISSVEPMDWTDELIALVASSPRIAKHAHLPMQSGSDAVLRRMHRKYRPWHYREKIEKIRAAMPTAAIGADVMVGFPGETDAEFEETRRMIEDLPFTYLHVFTYSPRPGTLAAGMPGQVPVRVARERNRILRDLAAEKKLAFMRSFVGKTMEAITLARGFDDPCGADTPVREREAEFLTEALTDNYLPLLVRRKLQPNQWLQVRIEGVRDKKLLSAQLVP